MHPHIAPAHRTRTQSDSSSSMSIRSETRLPVVTHSHMVFISFELMRTQGVTLCHGAGIQNRVIDTSFPY